MLAVIIRAPEHRATERRRGSLACTCLRPTVEPLAGPASQHQGRYHNPDLDLSVSAATDRKSESHQTRGSTRWSASGAECDEAGVQAAGSRVILLPRLRVDACGLVRGVRVDAPIEEAVDARSPKLCRSLADAEAAGHALIVDGTLIPPDRAAADRPFYSGKQRHGRTWRSSPARPWDPVGVRCPARCCSHPEIRGILWALGRLRLHGRFKIMT